MVVLPPAVSFWAMKAAWSDEMCDRSSARSATIVRTAAKRARTASSLVVGWVARLVFFLKYKRLHLSLSVGATRCVPRSILVHECCPLLLGLLNAPDTLSIPALHSTFAIDVRRLPNRPSCGLKDRCAERPASPVRLILSARIPTP